MWVQMFGQSGGFYLRLERAELMLCSSGSTWGSRGQSSCFTAVVELADVAMLQ
jgi:hypothetical protein